MNEAAAGAVWARAVGAERPADLHARSKSDVSQRDDSRCGKDDFKQKDEPHTDVDRAREEERSAFKDPLPPRRKHRRQKFAQDVRGCSLY